MKLRYLGLSLLCSVLLQANVLEKKALITIGEKSFEVPMGEKSSIEIEKKTYPIMVKEAPISTFNYDLIRFDFPSHFSFSYDGSSEADGLKMYSIDGDSIAVMVMDYAQHFQKEVILNSITQEYRLMKAKIEQKPVTLKLGDGSSIQGDQFIIYLGNVTLSQEIYVLYMQGHSLVLLLQDLIDNQGKHTAEYAEIVSKVKETLTVKKK